MKASGGSIRPFSPVLCPVDFSDHSRVALRFAAALCRRANAPLRVFFVNDPLLVAAAAAAYNSTALGEATETELRRFVSGTLPARSISGTAVSYGTALGKPAREILREAERGQYGAIVIGTKGLNGARRMLLGSTTAEVLRRTRVPVLAVPPANALPASRIAVPSTWPGSRIVAAIEFGPRGPADARQAAEVARWFNASLLLLHVVPVPLVPPWFTSGLDSQLALRCSEAQTALDSLRAGVAGSVRATTLVRTGDPPDEIAAVAAEQKAGVIVMGLRGRDRFFGGAPGSWAYHVISHGVAPVLVLPEPGRLDLSPRVHRITRHAR